MSVKTQMTPKGAQPLLQRPAEAATRTTPVQTGPFEMRLRPHDRHAPVAQLDRAPDYESGGQRFESFRARHFLNHENMHCGARERIFVHS